MEHNVALQNIAKRHKEENEWLRAENAALQQKVAQLEEEKLAVVATLYQPRKRAVGVDDDAPVKSRKRAKTITGPPASPLSMPSLYPSSPSSTSSTESYPSPTFEARSIPYRTTPSEASLFPNYSNENNNLVRTSAADDTDSPFERFDCGFCDDNTPCVCREILQQHVADGIGRPNQPTMKIDHIEAPGIASSSRSQAQSSILDRLPAYQPAVPLRRKNKQKSRGNSIFPVVQQPSSPSTCSGDPRNCRACASDDFGKAFCDAVNESMAASSAVDPVDTSEDPASKSPAEAEPEAQAMVPCDDAWRQFKSHPNVEFSDLKLLADVVVRGSRCTGPSVVISPALTPERVATPTVAPGRLSVQNGVAPGPQNATAVTEYRRIGVRTVPVEAVQAALDLLDAKSSMSLS
jgi:hypothetical protein